MAPSVLPGRWSRSPAIRRPPIARERGRAVLNARADGGPGDEVGARGGSNIPYDPPAGLFDEMVAAGPQVRDHYRAIHRLWHTLTPEQVGDRRRAIDESFLRQGVTFNVYGDAAG